MADIPANIKNAVRDLHWMGRRYADGRCSYAPGMFNGRVRDLLAAGFELGEPLFARDGMGRAFDGLTEDEVAAAGSMAGTDDLCQVAPGIKGETVSAAPLQSTAGGDAVDRRLPRHFSLHFCANGYGFLSVYSDDVPELYISGSNDQAVTAGIEPVLSRILWDNYGTTIAGFCRRQAGSESEEAQRADTESAASAEVSLTHKPLPPSPLIEGE
jgi:hypothetical protein